jgi:hypothetical protein
MDYESITDRLSVGKETDGSLHLRRRVSQDGDDVWHHSIVIEADDIRAVVAALAKHTESESVLPERVRLMRDGLLIEAQEAEDLGLRHVTVDIAALRLALRDTEYQSVDPVGLKRWAEDYLASLVLADDYDRGRCAILNDVITALNRATEHQSVSFDDVKQIDGLIATVGGDPMLCSDKDFQAWERIRKAYHRLHDIAAHADKYAAGIGPQDIWDALGDAPATECKSEVPDLEPLRSIVSELQDFYDAAAPKPARILRQAAALENWIDSAATTECRSMPAVHGRISMTAAPTFSDDSGMMGDVE